MACHFGQKGLASLKTCARVVRTKDCPDTGVPQFYEKFCDFANPFSIVDDAGVVSGVMSVSIEKNKW